MNLNELHRRLLEDAIAIGNSFPLVITGGYAIQAHGLVDRPSRDVDVATDSGVPMESIVVAMMEGLPERGWEIDVIGIDPLSARLMESLGWRHARDDDFSLENLTMKLDGASWYDDQAFAEYGLTEGDIAGLRRWAQDWSDDINRRIYGMRLEEDDLP